MKNLRIIKIKKFFDFNKIIFFFLVAAKLLLLKNIANFMISDT